MDATPFLPPEGEGWDELAAAAQDCRGCPLYAGATQAVIGEGRLDARVVLGGGHRPRRRLCDEHRQALQVQGARQAARQIMIEDLSGVAERLGRAFHGTTGG